MEDRAVEAEPVGATRPASSATAEARPDKRLGRRKIEARLEFPTARDGEAAPRGLLAADLDGDAGDELVAATSSPGTLQIWRGLTSFLQPAPEPRAFAVGDYPLGPVWYGTRRPARDDPDARIVLASRETLELCVVDLRVAWRAPADADLPRVWSTTLPHRPRVLAAGDLGLDGVPDVAVITVEEELFLFRRSEEVARTVLADADATCALFLSDGSGLVIGFQSSRSLAILRAGGDGSALTVERTISLAGLPRDLDELDVDGDGDLELVIAGGAKDVWIAGLDAVGGAAAWNAGTLRAFDVGSVPIDLEHARFRDTFAEEIVCLTHKGLEYERLRFDGKQSIARAREYAGQDPHDAVIGDFDGDGNVDVAVSNASAKRVSVVFGDAHGAQRSALQLAAGRSPFDVIAGDVDHSGYDEILSLNALDETVSLWKNERGNFAPAATSIHAPGATALDLADLDADGNVDAAWLAARGGRTWLVIWFGDGKGGLAERASNPPLELGQSGADILLADCSADSRPDVLVADPDSNRVLLLVNVQSETAALAFGPPTPFELHAGPRELALIELDEDAMPELAVALGGPGADRGFALLDVELDASRAVSLRVVARQAMDEVPLSLCVADFDGDRFSDVAVLAKDPAGDGPGFVVPFLRAAGGTWAKLAALRTGLRPYRIAARDLDGDRRAEIAVSAQNSHHINLWTPSRSGAPTFARTADLGASTGPLGLLFADLNVDRQYELVVANAFGNEVSVIRFRWQEVK